MPDARYVRDWNEQLITAAASVSVGEVFQLASGEAAVYLGIPTGGAFNPVGASSGDRTLFETAGKYTVTKATGIAILDGGPVYWDHSANAATFRQVSDRDFFIGCAVGDSGSGDASLVVDLNKQPQWTVDLGRDAFQSVLVGTPAAGGFGFPVRLGGSHIFELTATSEAQKVDALSVDGFAKVANAIASFGWRVLSDGAAGSQDISIGLANGTHASDADAITESILFHLNGGDTVIYAESDDGTTEVAATDTTTTYTEGSALANRVEGWIDFRNPADPQLYINAVKVLEASVFNVDASAGPWFVLIHVEKATGTDVYKLALDWARVRTMEQ